MIKTTIDYWDTPFPFLEGDVATDGIPMWVRHPLGDNTFTLRSALANASQNTSAVSVFENGTYSTPILADGSSAGTEGRTASLIGYWAGGAPGYHGASFEGQVAYRWRCYMRPVLGRTWWSSTSVPTFALAFGGNGFIRIDKTVGATVTTLFSGDVKEADILNLTGLFYTANISDMGPGDYFDIYYVQDKTFTWGGFVFKAVLNPNASGDLKDQARKAPVLGCDLFDSGTQPTKVSLSNYGAVAVARRKTAGGTASIALPLINEQIFDAVGWAYRRQTGDDPGFLRMYTGSPTSTTDVRRQRLIRIKEGFTDSYATDELYTTFTGMVDDFGPVQNGQVTVECKSFEQRVLDQYIKNYPDRISYMAANYVKRRGTSEPVYDITAYDNWPLELALRDLLVRAGLPEGLTRQALTLPLSNGNTALVQFGTDIFEKFRARSMAGNLIRLERPVHYGNAGLGANPKKTPDDPYLFKPENTKEIWNTVREITERYGYDLWTDEFGHVILRAVNNPAYVLDVITQAGSTQKVHPNAYGGTYQEWTSGTPVLTYTFTASRIDLVLPRTVSEGNWTFTVKDANNLTVSSGTINPSLPSGSADEFFYDFRTTPTGTNACVVTLYTGEWATYTVTLTGTGGASSLRRLDCFLLWYADPLLPRFDHLFSTDVNALEVQAQGAMDDMRNYVIIVGRRKAIVTTSNQVDTNPNNPQYEFIVESAVDVGSIVDPTTLNFIGYQKESIIYDTRISDSDYAKYLAAAFIFRYRVPKPSAIINHTLMPVLQLLEPLYAVEQKFESITADSVLWVTGFTHVVDLQQGATTRIETTAYAPVPSYEPRDDIDIDANFNGNPIVNVRIDYTSLDGAAIHNPKLNAPGQTVVYESGPSEIVEVSAALGGGSISLSGNPWPPVPGTVVLYPPTGAETGAEEINTIYTPPSMINFDGTTLPPGRVPYNGSFTTDRLENLQYPSGIIGVSLIVTQSTITGPVQSYTIPLTTTRPTVPTFDLQGQWYYEVNYSTQKVTAIRVNGPVPLTSVPADPYTFSLAIDWQRAKTGTVTTQGLANNPYHHFFNINYSSPTLAVLWKQGDGTALYTQPANATYTVKYRSLFPLGHSSDPYSGACPFYDPYTAEIGYLVDFKWDALVSGLYRISVRAVVDDTVIAWLTEPASDPADENLHWTFYTAGADKLLDWGGVDDVGFWNERQSTRWAAYAHGAFEQDEQPKIGKGFYAWNREETGDGTLGPLAFISDQREGVTFNGKVPEIINQTGRPVFGVGTYGCWYIRVDVQNDRLQERDGPDTFRTVKSTALDTTFNDSSQAVIYSHLPNPVQIEIASISDFVSNQSYDPTNPPTSDTGYWQTLPDSAAIVHNHKPVRFRYAVSSRPGILWQDNANKAQFKLNELVHLKRTLFDQFVVWDGSNYPGTPVAKATIVNRRLTNDDQTIVFKDKDWTSGEFFKTTTGGAGREWVFIPKDFKKDFGNGAEESLRFMDYLQLEEVPFWDETKQIAGKRSRIQIAFINDLFYFSMYSQDLSGRMVWAVNRKFLDRSKILQNQYGDWPDPSTGGAASSTSYRNPLPDDPHYQHMRSVVVRQWQDEAGWRDDQINQFSLSGSLAQQLLRHAWSDHEVPSGGINGISWASLGGSLDNYTQWHAVHNQLPAEYLNMNRQLGTGATTALGLWTWESSPLWAPCISRDFHPYFLLPPMPDLPVTQTTIRTGTDNTFGTYSNKNEIQYNKTWIYVIVDPTDYDQSTRQGRDAAASEVWNSPVWDMTQAYDGGNAGLVRFWPGYVVDNGSGPTLNKLPPQGSYTNVVDYERQDQMNHYEDFRGMFSRGKRPGEGPRKVTPIGPYYVNPYDYEGFSVEENALAPGFPKFRLSVFGREFFFGMKFRSEYLWHSGAFFPTNSKGVEALGGINFTKTRFLTPAEIELLRLDDGAYTGWKDDLVTGFSGAGEYRLYINLIDGSSVSAFETGFMPVAVGPRIFDANGRLITLNMLFSMVLVDSRREGAV